MGLQDILRVWDFQVVGEKFAGLSLWFITVSTAVNQGRVQFK